jgi:hypothetical protein
VQRWVVVIEVEDPGTSDPLEAAPLYVKETEVREMFHCLKPPFDHMKVRISSVDRIAKREGATEKENERER